MKVNKTEEIFAALITAQSYMIEAYDLMIESKDADIRKHGNELLGAALIVDKWIDYIQENITKPLDNSCEV